MYYFKLRLMAPSRFDYMLKMEDPTFKRYSFPKLVCLNFLLVLPETAFLKFFPHLNLNIYTVFLPLHRYIPILYLYFFKFSATYIDFHAKLNKNTGMHLYFIVSFYTERVFFLCRIFFLQKVLIIFISIL